MCYAHGSIEQVTRTCIMCKVYPPRLGCPHQPLGLCRNRQNHPRFDVVHFRNAELDYFNGCGYCKWAKKQQPSSSEKSWANSGFPGCCRAPKPFEFSNVKTALEWKAINIIHGTPIPQEFLQQPSRLPSSPNGSVRNVPHHKKPSGKTSPISVPGHEANPPPSSWASPPSGSALSSSNPESWISDAFRSPPRRKVNKPATETVTRTPVVRGLVSVPIPVNSVQSITVSAHTKNSPPKDQDAYQAYRKRRSMDGSIRPRVSFSDLMSSYNQKTIPLTTKTPSLIPRSTLAMSSPSSSAASAASTIDSATITSDGFTDYLSDESDQELQRQAEVKAAELELAKQEKAEFDAALQTVRHLCLQPPPEWSAPPSLAVSRPKAPRNASLSSFPAPSLVAVPVGNLRQ